MKKIYIITAILFFAAELNLYAQLQNKKVLILNSYHPQYKWTQEVTNSLKGSLEKEIPEENIFIEYLDGRRFINDKEYLTEITKLFKFKFKTRFSPDLIISIDDYAFQFVLKHGEDIFHNTPTVFGGVNVFDYSMLNNTKNITGILEGAELPKNLDNISSQIANLDKLYILSDQSVIGEELTKIAISELSKRDISYQILNDFTSAELEVRLKTASSNSAALLLAVHSYRDGKYFSYAKDLPYLSKISNIPIYGMWGMLNGQGVVGGFMTDGYTHGQEIYDLSHRILKGELIKDNPVRLKTNFIPQFDYNQLKRFNLSVKNLPIDSKVINQPESFYTKHKALIITTILLVLGLMIIIAILNQMVKVKTKHLDAINLKLKEFVGIVAHDLRNPISSIMSLSELAMQGYGNTKDVINMIRTLSKNSLDLVTDILELSAIESGKIKIELSKANLNLVISDIQNQMSIHASKKIFLLKQI